MIIGLVFRLFFSLYLYWGVLCDRTILVFVVFCVVLWLAVAGRRRLAALAESLRRSVEEVFGIEVSPGDIPVLVSRFGLRSYLILRDEEAAVMVELVLEGRPGWGSRHA